MKNSTLIVLIIVSVVSIAAITKEDGRAGANGAPGETTCNTTQCHTGNAVNSGGGSVVITAPTMPGWQYVPGQVYPISVTVAKTGVPLFGFGFEAIRSTGANAGTLSITNAVQTQLKSAIIGPNIRTNVVHQQNGGLTANSHTFTFNWTAPVAGTGTIMFYSGGNAANNNGFASGDFIYTTSQTVTELTSGLPDIASTYALHVFPSPVTDKMNIHFALTQPSQVDITILDIQGKHTALITSSEYEAGTHVVSYEPTNVPKGLYLAQVKIGEAQMMKRIVVM